MNLDHKVLVNGQAKRNVPVSDRGLAYGDGVFETMLCVDDEVPLLQRHLTRLELACKTLDIPSLPRQVWEQDVRTVLEDKSYPGRSVVKLLVTRGSGGFGYAPADRTEPTRIVQWLAAPTAGNSDELACDVLDTRLGSNRQLAGIKHLNRLEQVLAAKELRARKLDEGLVCNQHGFVIEAVSSNVVVVFGDRALTPKLDTAGVRGVMRDLLIEATDRSKRPIVKDFIHCDVIDQADEIILCNSVRGVRRVGFLGGKRLSQRTVFDELSHIAGKVF